MDTPVKLELVSSDKIKREMKKAFLEAYSSTALVKSAAEMLGIPIRTLYLWRSEDPAFAQDWDHTTHNFILPQLEQAAIERAMDRSDILLIFLMKAYNRKMYDDRQAVPQGDNRVRLVLEVVKKEPDGPETVTVASTITPGKLS